MERLVGTILRLPTFLLEVGIHQLTPVMVEVLSSDAEPFVLLGRDVMNHYRIVLDGPNLTLEIG